MSNECLWKHLSDTTSGFTAVWELFSKVFMVEKCSVAAFSDMMADEQLLQVVSDLG